jgi:MoxR-like ATPase
MTVLPEILALKERMAKEIIGQSKILDYLLVGMLSNGNVLVEGLPGLAKTRAIKALSNNLECDFNRIQFTPDITSGDIVGREIYIKPEGSQAEGVFKFNKGPVFANVVLADEVNRAPPRSQNALLEAMEERQVTIAAVSHKVPDLFMVMATMNPATQEGVFAMPEAQMDRFLLHISVDYPTEEAEVDVVRLIRKEQSQKARLASKDAAKQKAERILTKQETIFAARAELDIVPVPPEIERYMVDLIFATRYPERYTYELRSFILVGASPRASLAIDRTARAHAWLHGNKEVTVEDVQAMLKGVLRHRIKRGTRAIEHRITADDIVQEIIELVPTPAKRAEMEKKAREKKAHAVDK